MRLHSILPIPEVEWRFGGGVREGMSFAHSVRTPGARYASRSRLRHRRPQPSLKELPCTGSCRSAEHWITWADARCVETCGSCSATWRHGRSGAAARDRRFTWASEAYFCDRLDPEVRKVFTGASERLAADGHQIRRVSIDHAARTADVYLHIVLPEASWFHAATLERYPERYSPAVRLRLEMGRYVLAEDYVRAMFLRSVLTRAVDRALDGATLCCFLRSQSRRRDWATPPSTSTDAGARTGRHAAADATFQHHGHRRSPFLRGRRREVARRHATRGADRSDGRAADVAAAVDRG